MTRTTASEALRSKIAEQDAPALTEVALPVGLLDDAVASAGRRGYGWASTLQGRAALGDMFDELLTLGWTIHVPGEVCTLVDDDLAPRSRKDDAATSDAAARSALPSARGVAAEVLRQFRRQERWLEAYPERLFTRPTGYTADELAEVLGRPVWRRLADLARLELVSVALDDDGRERTRPGRSGRAQRVYRLTKRGRTYVEGRPNPRTDGDS